MEEIKEGKDLIKSVKEFRKVSELKDYSIQSILLELERLDIDSGFRPD